MNGPNEITVIVPTALRTERAASIARAVDSIVGQDKVRALPMLVVNGSGYDPALLRHWRNDPRVTVHFLELGNLPGAIRYGRSQVVTPYFCFLDDDDCYEPDTLHQRVAAFTQPAEECVDVVITNGWREFGDHAEPCFDGMAQFADDPLRSLLRHNWLASCGGTFRSDAVGLEFFDGTTPYLEWTTTAFRCALALRIRFLEIHGFRIGDSPASLSKSSAYRRGVVDGLSAIARLPLPADVRAAILRRRGDALHDLAEHYCSERLAGAAWRAHLACLAERGGLRYLSFTTRLLLTRFGSFGA